MSCSFVLDYLNKQPQLKYITAIYEDNPLEYFFDEERNYITKNIKIKKTLKFNNLKELLYFPNKKLIKGLDLSNQNICDINFLYEFINIESLNLSNNIISDLSNLQYLYKLKKLNLSNNKINNLKYLDRCLNLEQVFLINNKIDNLIELRTLSELKILDVTNTDIINLQDLDENKKLEYICFNNNINSYTLDKKLKNKIIYEDKKIITSYNIYFNKYYKSSDGFCYNNFKFTL